MRSVLKALPIAALGCAAALLVACGERNGLLSGSQAGSLQDALSAVQSACDDGNAGHAAIAAQSFAERVDALPPGKVDRQLVDNLRQGASTLEALVARSCTPTATTTTTPTTPTTTAPTTTETTTTATTTTPTTTAPTTTTPTTPTTPPPDNGGGTPGEGDGGEGEGGAPANPGGATPGQVKKALKEQAKALKQLEKEHGR